MSDLEAKVSQVLGPVMAEHVKAKRLVLIVEADGPEWASQVKALEKQLINTLSVHLDFPIGEIQVRVRRQGPQ